MFYLVDLSQTNKENFHEQFEAFATKRQLGSYEVYQVFGTSDFMVKMWLPAADEGSIVPEMRTAIDKIDSVQPFKVSDTVLSWAWMPGGGEPDRRDLDGLSVEKLQVIQQDFGHESAESAWAEERGLSTRACIDLQRDGRELIRFATAIKLPFGGVPDRRSENVVQIRKAVGEMVAAHQLERASVYLGFGFASVVIMADTTTFYRISELIDEKLTASLAGTSASTSTYLVANLDPIIRDEIGESTLRRLRQVDPAIKALFPELYDEDDGHVLQKLRQSIEHWMRDSVIDSESDWPAKDFNRFLRGPLDGIRRRDADYVNAQLFLAIGRCERYLRDRRVPFISKALGPEAIGRITQAVVKENPSVQAEKQSGSKEVRFKNLSLGVLLDIYTRAIRELDPSLVRLFEGDWKAILMLRNKLAHGELEPLQDWKQVLTDFRDFALRFMRIQGIADKYLTDPLDTE